jgi:hypothetical protein
MRIFIPRTSASARFPLCVSWDDRYKPAFKQKFFKVKETVSREKLSSGGKNDLFIIYPCGVADEIK